jgi:exopolysaccharide production protein ExoQ
MKSRLSAARAASAGLFALAPAFAVGGALGFAVLLCVAGALSLQPSLVRAVWKKQPVVIGLLFALTVWATLSTAWSPYPAIEQALKVGLLVPLGLMFASASTADASMRRLTAAGGVATVVVLIVLLAIEAGLDMPFNRVAQPDIDPGQLLRNVGRGAAFLVVLVWGAVGSLAAIGGGARLGAAAAILAATAAISLQFDQLANAVAFVVGLAAFAFAFAAPRLGVLVVTSGLALWVLIAPFATPLILSNQRLVDALPLSWASRAGIWDYVCARILEQPWIGHGLEASRTVEERIQVRDLDMRGIPMHPHSASLQIWFETGVIGAILAAAALLLGGRWLARAYSGDRTTAAAAAATMAAAGVIANVSFGAWAEWWIATMFIAAAVVASIRVR